jgi:hypothetical protein
MTGMRLNGTMLGQKRLMAFKPAPVVPCVSYRPYSQRPMPACHYTSVKGGATVHTVLPQPTQVVTKQTAFE